jgi:hypothetical protein
MMVETEDRSSRLQFVGTAASGAASGEAQMNRSRTDADVM